MYTLKSGFPVVVDLGQQTVYIPWLLSSHYHSSFCILLCYFYTVFTINYKFNILKYSFIYNVTAKTENILLWDSFCY